MQYSRFLFITLLVSLLFLMKSNGLHAQNKTTTTGKDSIAQKDASTTKKIHKGTIPKVAARKSAILPGWGQIYNHKAWKVPIVYAALGVTGAIFIDNVTWYSRVRYATKVAYNIRDKRLLDPVTLQYSIPDSSGYKDVHPRLKGLIGNVNALVNYRSSFRQNVDYSVLFFIFAWGLNVIDATVDAHLSSFDVSNDLSLRIKPIVPITGQPGFGFAINLEKPKHKLLPTFKN